MVYAFYNIKSRAGKWDNEYLLEGSQPAYIHEISFSAGPMRERKVKSAKPIFLSRGGESRARPSGFWLPPKKNQQKPNISRLSTFLLYQIPNTHESYIYRSPQLRRKWRRGYVQNCTKHRIHGAGKIARLSNQAIKQDIPLAKEWIVCWKDRPQSNLLVLYLSHKKNHMSTRKTTTRRRNRDK